jgi:hypothetical protein
MKNKPLKSCLKTIKKPASREKKQVFYLFLSTK